MAQARRPELPATLGRIEACALQLERAGHALAVVGVNPRGHVRLELGVQRRRAGLGDLRLHPLPDLGRDRRLQVELGEGGPHVEPGPSDHDRGPARIEEIVDLGPGQLREAPGAELLARIDEADETVL